MTRTRTWAILCVMVEALATASANAFPSGTGTEKACDHQHVDPGGEGSASSADRHRRRHCSRPPLAPIDLTAWGVSPDRIDLEWTNVSKREIGIKVERAAGSTGRFTLIAILPAGTTTYTDAGLTSTAYCYRLSAYNANGSSRFTNPACTEDQAGHNHGGHDHHHRTDESENREERLKRAENEEDSTPHLE